MYQSFRGKHQILRQAKPAEKGGHKPTFNKSRNVSKPWLDYTQLHNTKDLYPVTSARIPLGIQKRGPRSVPSFLQPGPIHNLGEVGPYDTFVTAIFSTKQLLYHPHGFSRLMD
ncbi:hypothetical protein QBC32DRAFT_374468 [Pseudoneurospora amorphoporcata]|uniref:Uncharacterized protein n=1 Tax=Pseudoneurospora amorphoporcata TaxID=241081 RepID=A0AAN6SBL2_9PEZI|nr:hypothetical protein QBC32DRAFT_374468 [Pseudoneurospora amorphoporcata]